MIDAGVTSGAKSSTRGRLVMALDATAVALLLLASAIMRSGGVVFYISRLRVSLGSSHRALLALLIVVVVRLIVARRNGPFGFWTERWQHLLDSMQHEPLIMPPRPGARRRLMLAAIGIGAVLVVLLHEQVSHLDRLS